MPATTIDEQWFRENPDRRYRLRRQTPGELERWPTPPRTGLAGYCIIHRDDGAVELFALAEGEAWDDEDAALAPFFAHRRAAA